MLVHTKKKGININDIKAQGFKLKVRCHGGAGRTLCKKIVHFTGIPHILQVKLFTLDSLLLVTAYEPRTSASLHMQMPMYLRKLILGSGSDDHRVWIDKLMQRVKINWRGNRSLYVDSTIHRSVRKISGKRMLLKIEQHSETEIKIIIIDTKFPPPLNVLSVRKTSSGCFYINRLMTSYAVTLVWR